MQDWHYTILCSRPEQLFAYLPKEILNQTITSKLGNLAPCVLAPQLCPSLLPDMSKQHNFIELRSADWVLQLVVLPSGGCHPGAVGILLMTPPG